LPHRGWNDTVTVEALSAELREPAVDVLVMPAVVCLTQPAGAWK
jgi:hypothetical protein